MSNHHSSHTYPIAQPTKRRAEYAPLKKFEFRENGVRYYESTDGRTWDADTFDRVFTPAPTGKLLPRNTQTHTVKEGRGRRPSGRANTVEFDRGILKICNTCGKEKELKEFHNAKNSSDGKRNDCILCARSKSLNRYHSTTDNLNEMI